MRQDFLWGIDLGGTKIEGVVLKQTDDTEVIFRSRVPTEADKGYTSVVDQIKKLVNRMENEVGQSPCALGIGSPGIIDPLSGKLKNSTNATCLNNKPIQKDLEIYLGVPIKMANDANCFAIAEARHGAVKHNYPDASVVFGVIIGTGVGGGVVVNNSLINGRHGIGGEWGHNFLDDSGYQCHCGKKGCVESVISGRALEYYYRKESGIELDLENIVSRAENSTDEVAQKTMTRLFHYFGKAIAVVVNILDPDVIVIGGGVSNIDSMYTKGRAEIQSHIFNNRFDTPIIRPMLGDASGVIGAAYLTI